MKTNGFYEQEYATKREVIDIATQIASSLIDDSDEIKGTVLLFADLPSASLWTDKLWIVQQSSGSWLTLNYKQSGIYKSNGTTWGLLDSTDDIISSFNTKADKTITISAGSGLTGGGDLSSNKTISHADTSSQANVNNTNGNVIQSITLDTFGHIQSIESVNLDTRYTIANLGATTIGANLFTLPNPNAITFLRINADNTASTLNATDFRTAIGASATATANSLVLRDSAGSFLATNGGFSGQVAITRAWDGANSKGQIYLTGLTGNRIDYVNIGLGLPTTTTRSVGTKIVYRSGLNSTDTDYATGIDTNIFWHSIPNTTASFNWYASTTNIASLSGNGVFTALSFVKSGGLSTQFLKADGSVDSTSYLPLSGGTMSGAITFAVGQTWPTWSIAQGGTGATTAAGARTNLGLGSSATLNAGAANGVATLDSSGTIPLAQIPASLQGALQYAGTWDASINSPTLTSGAGTKGYYYVVNVAGSTALNGINEWKIGDWAIYNGTAWQKIDNTDAVVSVNGLNGAVVLSTSNVAEGTNLYYTDTRTRLAISSTATGLTYNNGTGVFTLSAGYSIPTTASQTNWDTAFNDRNKWDGGATGLVASAGRTSLGATTLGSNLFTLTNPSAISFLRINADNSVSALDATTFRGAISAGTITSVSVVTANGISGSVATSTTTPAITLTLGEITPTTVKATSGVLVFATSGTNRGTIRTSANEVTIESQGVIHFNYFGGGFGGAQPGRAPVYFWKGSNYGTGTIPSLAFDIEGTAGMSTCHGIFRQNGNYTSTSPSLQVGDVNYGFSAQNSILYLYAGSAGYRFKNSARNADIVAIDDGGNLSLSGNITINGGATKRLDFSSGSYGPPSTGSRSAGTKIVLWPDLSASKVDYAIGIDGGTLWNSVPTAAQSFKWYAGTNIVATLNGSGQFSATNIDASQNLSYNGTLYASGPAEFGGYNYGNGRINMLPSTSGSTKFFDFWRADQGMQVGSISTNGVNTFYNNSSDYRLKQNIAPVENASDKVLRLKPCSFNYIGHDWRVDGFIAHEIQEVVDHVVTGKKDAVHKDGSINAQQIDQSRLVPLLTAALQDALKKIKNLEKMVQNSSVIQTLQVVKSNVSTYTNIAVFTDLDGLSLTITPSSATSKFLIRATITFSIAGATTCLFRFVRNGIPVGIGNSGIIDASFGGAPANTAWATTVTGEFLDSPNTGSAIVYKIQFLPYDKNRVVVINRTFNGANVDNGQRISTLTIQEIL